MNPSLNKIKKYAEHLMKIEFMKYRLDVFQNVCSSEGIDFLLKTKTGNYYEISLQVINLEKDRSIKIPKTEIGYELKDKYFIALVLFLKDMEPAIYLIPVKTFKIPNKIFIDNDQGERFRHLSNWEIKIFTRGIQELSEFAFNTMILQLK